MSRDRSLGLSTVDNCCHWGLGLLSEATALTVSAERFWLQIPQGRQFLGRWMQGWAKEYRTGGVLLPRVGG